MQIHKYVKKDKMRGGEAFFPVQRTKEVKTEQEADCLLLVLAEDKHIQRILTFTGSNFI